MSAEKYLQIIRQILLTTKIRTLNKAEVAIIIGVLNGYTYEEIAARNNYATSHIRNVASKLWQLLSQVLNMEITKNNFHDQMLYYWQKYSDNIELKSEVHLYKEHSIKEQPVVTLDSNKKESEENKNFYFVLSGTFKETDKAKLEAIINHLQKITGDVTWTIQKIDY